MNHTKLSAEEILEIDRHAAAGEGHRQIATAMGIKRNIVRWRIDVAFRLEEVNRARRLRGRPPLTMDEYKIASAKTKHANAVGGKVKGSILEPVSIEAIRAIVPFVGWRAQTCQWIAGEPKAGEACKCGAPVVEDHNYCAEHARASRIPGTSINELRATRRRIPIDPGYQQINPGRLSIRVGATL